MGIRSIFWKKIWVNFITTSRRDLTGIMGNKGSYPKIALIQVSEILLFAQICLYDIYIYILKHLGYSEYISNIYEYKPYLVPEHFGEKQRPNGESLFRCFCFHSVSNKIIWHCHKLGIHSPGIPNFFLVPKDNATDVSRMWNTGKIENLTSRNGT